jgi:hypothetical protein
MSKSSLAKSVATGEPDLIDILIYFEHKESKNGSSRLKVLDPEEAQKSIEEWKKADHEEDAECPIETLNTKWQSASWLEQNRIIAGSQSVNPGNGQLEGDFIKYRDLRIKSLLVDWDLEHDNQKIPVTPEFIDRLPAEIVLALFDKYERLMVLDGDEQGK